MPPLRSVAGAHWAATSLVIGLSLLAPQHVLSQESASGLDAPQGETDRGPDEPSQRVAGVEFLAGTTAPLDVWTGVDFVLFERLLLTASVGRSAYGGLAGSIIRTQGADDAAAIIQPLLSDGWMLRLGLGVRPFGKAGPEALVGFARLNASATWDASTFDLPNRLGSLSADVGINMLYVELGWSIDMFGPVFVRPAIGWTRALGSSVSLTSTVAATGQTAVALEATGAVVEEAIDTYGMTPTLSLSIGARL